MKNLLDGKRLVMGTCYYPEHWSKSLWKEDLIRMRETGIEVIRIAEFSWSKVEPEEGCFTFDFWDEFLDLAQEMGMKVIFCTPTATPPAWLTEKYPEVLNADIRGIPYRHGMRRHYNYNSPKYRELCARITEKFASHYGARPCIIGWQIDNELNCEKDEFYSESDTKEFRGWLRKQYGSLNDLNEAWGTVFWNQTYTEWDEIYVPRYTYSNSVNPHQVLDYIRFISESVKSFAKLQSDILRIYCKEDDFITTNGLFSHMDNHQMTKECLDFFTYDSYPDFAFSLDMYSDKEGDLQDRKWSRNLSEVRAVSPVFGIMEQQSGACGWNNRLEAPSPRQGQITLWTMQSIAHGADFISYFRWRTCTFGTEMYWHGILDYSGRDNRRLLEIRDIHHKMECISEVTGGIYEANVGILKDYDNIWDAEIDHWHGRVESVSQKALYEAAQRSHTPVDYIYLQDDLTAEDIRKYRVLFYPHATMINEKRVGILQQYVAQGGILVVGCRSGYKDMHGHCVMEKLPGLLAELTGTDIPEYSLIAPDEETVRVIWEDEQFEAAVFTDLLAATGTEAQVMGRYASDYDTGTPALICNPYGEGQAWYYGSAFTSKAATVFFNKLKIAEPYRELITLPESCELAVRRKGSCRYLFVLNYDKKPQELILHQKCENLYDHKIVQGELVLEAYGTLVLKVES